MLTYYRAHHFTAFRLAQSLEKLQKAVPSILDLQCDTVYWVIPERELSAQEVKGLRSLLQGAERQSPDQTLLGKGTGLSSLGEEVGKTGSNKSPVAIQWAIVMPRIGTLSSWSSKATDIARVCGLPIARIESGVAYRLELSQDKLTALEQEHITAILADRMTESVVWHWNEVESLFSQPEPRASAEINVLSEGRPALEAVNCTLGLALTAAEIDYLVQLAQSEQRNLTYAELMMFAQVNSEHCRHKIFNAQWTIDGEKKSTSLFDMIRNTYALNPEGILTAYSDNSAVLSGEITQWFWSDPLTGQYSYHKEPMATVIKVETHNHPTAIAPHPGAATGSGGEIRDEGATGRGAIPKAGLVGFSLSHLHLPDFQQPWETTSERPSHIASALSIILEGPIGAAAFNNEFGRPVIAGYFRNFEITLEGKKWGYHKPIMIAGGLGNIRENQVKKNLIEPGMKLMVLGGPALLIGLGGGAASSKSGDAHSAHLDFASVQRANPEMQRRCQQVINRCWALGENNPIVSIHDVGAGGLSNALPELVHDSDRGAVFDLRAIPTADPSLSAMELWCNEAQERYVLAVHRENVSQIQAIAERERCPIAVVGEAKLEPQLMVKDSTLKNDAVNLAMDALFAKPPRLHRDVKTHYRTSKKLRWENADFEKTLQAILRFPAVASHRFLITIGDRSVTGLVARDQMVGPWQVPVADVGVTVSGFKDYHGAALAMGERTPIALLDAAAASRMAVGESITNIVAADIAQLSDIKLSANWMAACGQPGEDAALFAAVEAVGMELCPALGITIPVGKDSLSMHTQWQEQGEKKSVTSPVSLIVSAFAAVHDVRRTLTPELQRCDETTLLVLFDVNAKKQRLGGSVLAQIQGEIADEPPNLDDPVYLQRFFATLTECRAQNLILAYHDRSDGGLLITACEMTFAGRLGLTINSTTLGEEAIATLFNEELGALVQIKASDFDRVREIAHRHCFTDNLFILGVVTAEDQINVQHGDTLLLKTSRTALLKIWEETSYRIQSLRDDPTCAQEEFDLIADAQDPGLNAHLTFSWPIDVPSFQSLKKPRVAILREQGVNGHMEMAAAFDRVGFIAVDVHMSDILSGNIQLAAFSGLVACGGFSYGDVLGAGTGWAQAILQNPRARQQFATFFARENTFTLGVCNGCQMLSQLTEIIPGTDHWPRFRRNRSQQFEARLSLVEIQPSASILLKGMAGSRLPVVVSHGEGLVDFQSHAIPNEQVALRYVDHQGQWTERYPNNPNGSTQGITGLTSLDGRVTIMMPHPERVFRTCQLSWHPDHWGDYSPWLALFLNAKQFVDQKHPAGHEIVA